VGQRQENIVGHARKVTSTIADMSTIADTSAVLPRPVRARVVNGHTPARGRPQRRRHRQIRACGSPRQRTVPAGWPSPATSASEA
jgi:hypothetical protein